MCEARGESRAGQSCQTKQETGSRTIVAVTENEIGDFFAVQGLAGV